MTTMTIAEVQARLPDLIHGLSPGEEVAIVENNAMVARLVAPRAEQPQPLPGRGRGMLTILAEDDDHLEDFQEYMP